MRHNTSIRPQVKDLRKEQTQGKGRKSVLAEGTDYSRTQTSVRGRGKKFTSPFVEPDQRTEEIEKNLKG